MRGDEASEWRKDFLCANFWLSQNHSRWEGVRGERMTYARYFVDPKQLTNRKKAAQSDELV